MNGYVLTPVAAHNGPIHAVQGAVSSGPYDTVCGERLEVWMRWQHDGWRWLVGLEGGTPNLCPACLESWERVLADYAARVREVRAETDEAHARIRAGVGTAEDWALTYND